MIDVLRIMETDRRHKQVPADASHAEGSAFVIDKHVSILEAAVPITDCGFVHADACYDVVSVSRGMFFRLEQHVDRFLRSLPNIKLRSPYSRDRIREILIETVRLSGLKDAYVWWAVTRGEMPHGKERGFPDKWENRFYVFTVPYISIIDDEQRQSGINMVISEEYRRIPPNSVDPNTKNFHWLDLMMSLFEAVDRGGDLSVLTGIEGYISECPGSNIFMVKGGKVVTPSFGCLEGITRQATMDLCAMEGIPALQANITAGELRDADEIFFTSTAGGIMGVSAIDGKPVGGRKGVGPITSRLHDLYWNKRWEGWDATPVSYAE